MSLLDRHQPICRHGRIGCEICEETARLESGLATLKAELEVERQARIKTNDNWSRERQAANDELAAVKAKLNDLMAVIHGDGGHHRETVGEEQCWKDAMQVVSRGRANLNEARENWAKLSDDLAFLKFANQDEILEMKHENDAMLPNAERYLWWKAHFNAEALPDRFRLWVDLPTQERARIDDAIDEAMAKEQGS